MDLLMSDDQCWRIISDLGWGVKDCDINCISKELKEKLTTEEQLFLLNFVDEKEKNLYKILENFANTRPEKFSHYFGVSDDSFGDLVSHIVGLGKTIYNDTCLNPILAKKRADRRDFEENFSYCFQHLWEV
jgi:hypothetical protein